MVVHADPLGYSHHLMRRVALLQIDQGPGAMNTVSCRGEPSVFDFGGFVTGELPGRELVKSVVGEFSASEERAVRAGRSLRVFHRGRRFRLGRGLSSCHILINKSFA